MNQAKAEPRSGATCAESGSRETHESNEKTDESVALPMPPTALEARNVNDQAVVFVGEELEDGAGD
jgi:hypothetical protein